MKTTLANRQEAHTPHNPDWRTFLRRSLTAGALACLSCPLLRGANKFIVVNPPTGKRFYRLFMP